MRMKALAVAALGFTLTSFARGGPPASAPASRTSPTSQTAPASRPAELEARLMPAIRELAKIDAPGAEGFAGALARVLKKDAPLGGEPFLGKAPSEPLPTATKEQLERLHSQTVTNLLDEISRVRTDSPAPAEMALRVDLLEAFCRYAPSMMLRLQAADRLLDIAAGWGREKPPVLTVDPHRAVEAAKAAVAESLAAARDARDTLSMRTLVGLGLAKVAATMAGIDLLNLKDPTPESLEKARKQWDDQFAAWEKEAKDEDSKRVLALLRKSYSAPFTEAQVEAFLLPRQCRPLAEAFFNALAKKDRTALLAVLTPTTAAAVQDKDPNEWTKQVFGEVRRDIRVLPIGTPSSSTSGVSVPCDVAWRDEDGKEHRTQIGIPVVKTDKGWRVGGK